MLCIHRLEANIIIIIKALYLNRMGRVYESCLDSACYLRRSPLLSYVSLSHSYFSLTKVSLVFLVFFF